MGYFQSVLIRVFFFQLPSAAFLFSRKQLCPALIVILGNPIHDKTITSAHSSICLETDSPSSGISDHGRGSGCSSTAPALSGPVARTIYYIAAELVRLVGSVESMKPVLQSLYHRILLYPPPQHRVEAIKIMKEVGWSSVQIQAHKTKCLFNSEHCWYVRIDAFQTFPPRDVEIVLSENNWYISTTLTNSLMQL